MIQKIEEERRERTPIRDEGEVIHGKQVSRPKGALRKARARERRRHSVVR